MKSWGRLEKAAVGFCFNKIEGVERKCEQCALVRAQMCFEAPSVYDRLIYKAPTLFTSGQPTPA